MTSLILSGFFAAGFLLGLAFSALYRWYRARNSVAWFFRQAGKRKHSQRAPRKLKLLKRPRYSIDMRHFRFDPRSTRDW